MEKMTEDRRNRGIVIGVLCAVILFMSIGFAAISTRLTLTGTATVGSTWNVEITGIEKTDASTAGATDAAAPSFTATTATFNVELAQPGDKAVYNVTVENKGTIAAKLSDIASTLDSSKDSKDALTLTVTGVEEGAVLEAGKTHVFTMTAEYKETAQNDLAPTDGDQEVISVTLDYDQN